MKIKIIQLIMVLAGIFSTLSFAEKNPSLPPTKSQGQTQFISGGIGKIESEAMLHGGRSWSLMLVLARAAGTGAEYISDVHVTIKDERGNTILDTVAEGPYLLVNVAPGKYSLDAAYKSITLHRDLILGKEPGKKITLVWPGAKD
ncbi:MAG: hypothetical protein L0H37_05190 [Nitrosospira sp.]|nr:hypothetical protein [Nitrosospira sp.]